MATSTTLTVRQPGLTFADLFRLSLLASPVGVLALLLWHPRLDPRLQAPAFHFIIVTLSSGVALGVGILVLVVAERLRDARAFALGLAFTAIAGFLFIHGLLTPGFVFAEASNWIGWAPLVGLMLGAVFLLLSTVRQQPGGESWVFARRRLILACFVTAWASFLVCAIVFPKFLYDHPTSLSGYLQHSDHQLAGLPRSYASDDYSKVERTTTAAAQQPKGEEDEDEHPPWIAGILVAITGVLLLATTLRYARNYRLSRLPLHATIVAGLILLMESLLSFFFASVWHVSWWEYHALMLLGFVTIFYGLILDYRRDTSLTRTISSLLLTGSVAALEQSYSEVLTALVTAVEAKDPYTKGHSEKVARLAVQLGERLGLPPERLRVLYQAGLLHDIGKIGVPDWILNKPGRLTPSEFAVVRGHPARSEEMIGKIPSLRSTLPGIRWHHERLDGSGYPDGTTGDAIPLDARILAVADVFDAMTSGRSYRSAQPEGAALIYLQHHAGTLFDGQCVQALALLIEGPSAQTRVQHLAQPVPHQV
jgi:HD-GYP domain-containing protein (c-di-GMP phosphodiesterase class II)